MVKPHKSLYLAILKSDVVALGQRVKLYKNLDGPVRSVEIHSQKAKTWTHQYIKTEENSCYCVGLFMGKLYFSGGYIKRSRKSPKSCCTYDINCNIWNKIADLNVARDWAACTVFEGKIVVTGGVYNWSQIKSVEAYDYHEDKWIYLPDMIKERCSHAAVSMGKKMFVIGGYHTTSCEVFDSFSRKFANIYSKIKVSDIKKWYFYAYSFGNNIVVFQDFQEPLTETVVYLYESDNEKWINVQCDFTKNIFESSFVKYYT